jgi:hypothetical protein
MSQRHYTRLEPELLLIVPELIPEQYEEGAKLGPIQLVEMQKSGADWSRFRVFARWI